MPLPPFTDDGVLPAGDYPLTLAELRESFLVTGEGVDSPNWNTPWRRHLLDNLSVLVEQLWQVGIGRIFVNGSFVEANGRPNDIDGYFECDFRYLVSGQLQRDLNAIDPSHIWRWDFRSRRTDPNSKKAQLPMWRQYRVELYPHFPGIRSGIRDASGNELALSSAFRLSPRAVLPKGIVQIVR